MTTKEEIVKVIDKYNLFPVTPIVNYDDYMIPWKEDNPNRIYLKTISEILKNKDKVTYVNNDGIEYKNKPVTGFYLYTGEKSNIIVIDLDRHDNGKDGIGNFNEMLITLPSKDQTTINNTLTVLTKGGGLHLYFKYTSQLSKYLNFDSIEVMTNNRRVPVPGSRRRKSGKGDRTIGSYDILIDMPIQEMPQSLIDIFKGHYKGSEKVSKRGRPTKNSKYYSKTYDGERDNKLISWLGHIIKSNPNLRDREELIHLAEMYNLTYIEPPLGSNVVFEKVDSILNYAEPSYIENKKVIPYKLAENISSDNIIISDDYSCYVYKNGYYNAIHGDFYNYIDKKIDDKRLMKMQMVNEVSEQIRKQTHIKNITNGKNVLVENQRGYINFKNGIYDIKNRAMIRHSKDIISLCKINATYENRKVDIKGSNFERFLNSTFEKEVIPSIQELIGLCIYPLTDKINYFYILNGDGRNGKGTLLDIIGHIIPECCTSHVSLEGMCTRFLNAELKGKTVNMCLDDPTKYVEKTGELKSFTASEPVMVEFKGQKPINIQPVVTIISATNGIPKFNDKSNGLYKRMQVIPFNKSFGTKKEVERGECTSIGDPYLKGKIIKNELDLVASWGMEGLLKIIDNNYKLTECKSIEIAKFEYRSDSDSIYSFINKCIKKSEGKEIKATTLFCRYTDYCKLNDYTVENNTRFGKTLGEKMKLNKVKKRDGYYYKDIEVIQENEKKQIAWYV